MKIILSLVGLAVAAWVWENVHPLAGLVVGILFVGGAGWYFVGGIGARVASPSIRKHGSEFIRAWEELAGSMQMGREDTYPPPGLFQRWARERKASGISARSFLLQWAGLSGAEEPGSQNVTAREEGKGPAYIRAPAELHPLLLTRPGGPGIAELAMDGLRFRGATTHHFRWEDMKDFEVDGTVMLIHMKPGGGGGYLVEVKAGEDTHRWESTLVLDHGLTKRRPSEPD